MSPANKCWCMMCDEAARESGEISSLWVRMNLCPECGNKRCPKATDHRHECTGNNEPGQIGSAYCDQP